MAIYKVKENGNAPSGLLVGDQVVTGAGTYTITKVNQDGSYESKLSDRGQTTANYQGAYASASQIGTQSVPNTPATQAGGAGKIWAGAGEQVSHWGEGALEYDRTSGAISRIMPSGTRYYANPGDEKYDALSEEYRQRYGELQNAAPQEEAETALQGYQQLLAQSLQQQYRPVNVQAASDDWLSLDEAVLLAERALAPQYQRRYEQSARTAAQNLERAGLYDTLYGQALALASDQEVSSEMNEAIQSLALDLLGQDREQALDLLKLAVDENHYAADYQQEQLQTNMSYYLEMLDRLIAQANTVQDQQLALRAQALKEQIAQADISQTEAETKLKELQLQAYTQWK